MSSKICLYLLLFVAGIIPAASQINTNRVLAIGKNALYFEDYVLSIQYFNQVIKAKPHLADPYLYRAMAKFNLDDFKGAENDLTLCIERNPFLWYAYQCRGASRQSMNDFTGAIEDYNKGLEFRPEDKQMLINKSIAYILLKEYEPAISTLNLLLRYQPKHTQAFLVRGSAYLEQNDTLSALNDYNKAIELDKYYPVAYAQRGLLYLQQENYAIALKDLDEAIRLEPQHIGYHINRGLIKYHLNDLRGAMADYDKVIAIEAQNMVARFNRGLLRSTVGDIFGALDDFGEVIKQEPDNFMAIYNRAVLSVDAQHYRNAIADLDKVLTEYPNFVPGYYFRSDVKRKLNDTKGADTDYWYAYDLEQKLKKQREQGKIVAEKEALDSLSKKTNDENAKTREKSDKNIEKFNRLVVYDKEDESKSKYDNEIRGRVQDKQVKVDLKPPFVITYYERIEMIDRSVTRFDRMISEYNNSHFLSQLLKIVDNEASLSDDQVEYHFKSIDDHSLILKKDSNNADAYFGRALDYMILQDLSEAENDYSHAIRLNPSFTMAYFNRAVVRHKQMEITYYKEDSEAMTFNLSTNLHKNLSISSSSYISPTITSDKKSDDSRHTSDFNLLLLDYETVIRLNPDFVFAYFNRGNIRFIQKNFRLAIADYNAAIERNPDFSEAYFNRGLTRLSMGDTERGIDDLSKAGELGMIEAYSIIKRMAAN